MKLDTIIRKLSKAYYDYQLRFGKEPVIFDWTDGTLTLCAKVKWNGKKHVAVAPIKYHKIKAPWEHL